MATSSLSPGRTDEVGSRAVEAGLDALEDAAQPPKGPSPGRRLLRSAVPPR